VFTQTDISKFFSASHDFCGGGLGFSRLGPGRLWRRLSKITARRQWL